MLVGFVAGAVAVRRAMPNLRLALSDANEKLRAEIERARIAEIAKADLDVALADRMRDLGNSQEAVNALTKQVAALNEVVQKSAASIAALQENEKKLKREVEMRASEIQDLQRRRKLLGECLQMLSVAALKCSTPVRQLETTQIGSLTAEQGQEASRVSLLPRKLTQGES